MRAKAVMLAVAAVCVAVVLGYQLTRPARATSDPRVFVPSSKAFGVLPESLRVTLADAYWLYGVQYYGQHLKTDNRFDSLAGLFDVVTGLSPHFKQAYFTGALAAIDANRPDYGYKLLQRGFTANPSDWHFPSYLGFFVSVYGSDKALAARTAADWYIRASKLPGAPRWTASIAATLLAKGGARKAAVLQWGQIYASGDKYAKEKAVKGLEQVLPTEKQARMKALAPLVGTMSTEELDALIAELFKGYS